MRTGVWSWRRSPVLNSCRGNFSIRIPSFHPIPVPWQCVYYLPSGVTCLCSQSLLSPSRQTDTHIHSLQFPVPSQGRAGIWSSYTVADWENIFLCHLTEDLPVQYAAIRTCSRDVFFWFWLWNVGWCLSVSEINISVKCLSEMNVSGMFPFNSNCYHSIQFTCFE